MEVLSCGSQSKWQTLAMCSQPPRLKPPNCQSPFVCINLLCAEATTHCCGKTKENLEDEQCSGECNHAPATVACYSVRSTWFQAPVCSCHACLAWSGGLHLAERAAMRQHECELVLPYGDHPNHHGHPQPQLQHQLQLRPFFRFLPLSFWASSTTASPFNGFLANTLSPETIASRSACDGKSARAAMSSKQALWSGFD